VAITPASISTLNRSLVWDTHSHGINPRPPARHWLSNETRTTNQFPERVCPNVTWPKGSPEGLVEGKSPRAGGGLKRGKGPKEKAEGVSLRKADSFIKLVTLKFGICRRYSCAHSQGNREPKLDLMANRVLPAQRSRGWPCLGVFVVYGPSVHSSRPLKPQPTVVKKRGACAWSTEQHRPYSPHRWDGDRRRRICPADGNSVVRTRWE